VIEGHSLAGTGVATPIPDSTIIERKANYAGRIIDGLACSTRFSAELTSSALSFTLQPQTPCLAQTIN